MENTIYMDKYEFELKKEFRDKFNRINNKLFEYASEVYLANLKDDSEKNDNFELFHLLEENIEVKRNSENIEYPDIFMFEIFSSLILYLDKESFYCKAINKDNILYRFGIIEEACKNKYRLKQELKEIREVLEKEDDTQFFAGINESALVKCLFGNPYFRNEEFSRIERGFYLNGFINNLSIPVKIKEKIENGNIEIIGEIDTLIMNESNFIEKIKLEYGIDIEDYEFSYKLNLRKSREKIKTIEIQINLKLGKRYEINERIMII
ncbi:hypothetical protein JCM16775_0790 [Leptotrichia hofstadii]|uniref:Uncharacterized protein n=1 Tax=Leptotrichia hofstadii TaxID=157688 RepID=A0A510JJR8_9FUSO|nr:hypothetical protein [Leptotrichia hofstadii]BBM38083.1 hypothetical protein JCM16775_0790 [Leptotrichia hofstadii]